MIDEPLERLRRSNPVPSEVAPPPIENVMRRISAEAPAGRTPRRWVHGIVPALGVVAAIAVIVAAVLLLGHRSPAPPTRTTPGTTPSPPPLPTHGMPGVVSLYGGAFSSSGAGAFSFQQCQPCHAEPKGGQEVMTNWLALTPDGGRSWVVEKRPFLLFDAAFSGPNDGWAEGSENGSGPPGANRVLVTHDGGRSWARASGVGPSAVGSVSVADGEVWAVGNGCAGPCRVTVARASASASVLRPTPSEPVSGDADALVHAAGARTAYLEAYVVATRRKLYFVTRDGGRSWQPVAPGCRQNAVDRSLAADGPDSLWNYCPTAGDSVVLGRSTDGGRHWRRYRIAGFGGIADLIAPTSRVAWAITDHGYVTRTSDGGPTWRVVWKGSRSARLLVQGPQTAEVTVTTTRGHVQDHAGYTNLVVYRTADGGRSWQPSVVRLPTG